MSSNLQGIFFDPKVRHRDSQPSICVRTFRAFTSYKEVGIHHLPRRGGQATGSKLSVIIRAFRELFIFARKWKQEQHQFKQVMSKEEAVRKGF